MNHLFCWHNYGKPVGWRDTEHYWDDKYYKTTMILIYQCEKCGKVKLSKRLPYLGSEQANRLLKNK